MRVVGLLVAAGVATSFVHTGQEQEIIKHSYRSVHVTNATGGLPGFLDSSTRAEKPETIALEAVHQHVGTGDWRLLSSYPTKHNGVTHMAFRRYINGIECSNCDATVNVNAIGQILNLGYTAVSAPQLSAGKQLPTVNPEDAIAAFVRHAGLMEEGMTLGEPSLYASGEHESTFEYPALAKLTKSTGKVTAALKYIVQEDKAGEDYLTLAWKVELETEVPRFAAYEAFMDAVTGNEIPVAVLDHVNWDGPETFTSPESPEATYLAYPAPGIDPRLGDHLSITGPADTEASPIGWHDQGNKKFTDSIGNNVFAQENHAGSGNWQNNYRPDGGERLNFEFPIDWEVDPKEWKDASITNLFYWNNIIHDVFQLYGFDEVAGNFQETNFDRGGRGGDAVQANAQDGAGYNNANMMTPADGSRPRMRMYLWNQETPNIDGDLDSGIVIHEYGHGISLRLTGGPQNVGCLPWGQAGGMGEGWGDWWANMFIQTKEATRNDRFPMGMYAAGRGIRPFDYTYDMDVNPQTFGFLNRQAYNSVHATGSVWCQILFDVYWEMRGEHGFDADWYRGTGGNNALFRNVVDGLKLQPCYPGFIEARDAILLADSVNYDSKHVCTMWRGFARRGLGASATSGFLQPVREAFDLPRSCQ